MPPGYAMQMKMQLKLTGLFLSVTPDMSQADFHTITGQGSIRGVLSQGQNI
jgi:hypothetical protein